MAVNIQNVRIGDVLKEYGYITEDQMVEALSYQKQNKGVRLGGALIALGYINEKQMLEALAKRLHMETKQVSEMDVDVKAVQLIPQNMAERYCMLGTAVNEGTLKILVNDPLNFYGLEDIRQATGLALEVYICEKAPLEEAIHYYYSEVSARDAASRANESTNGQEIEELQVEEGDDDTPIVNLLNSLIQRAYTINASDIHIEPREKQTVVRMRVDGVMTEYVTLQKSLHGSLIARIKIVSDLDIAERRVPQDGHFKLKMGEAGMVNIRVSVIPTVFGEKAVMRLMGSNTVVDHSGTFGMDESDFKKLSAMLKFPNGIIYMTGPTGSGKSTTLYMILEEMSKRSVNICTIEDPVEKNLTKVSQMQVNNVAGLTFSVGLRALLRQDPDIIMIGETRDAETASIAVRAAITGHLVFSTLHTNDAASSIVRLIDMGVESYMAANAVVGIVAQRLMRKVCPECCETGNMTESEQNFVGKWIPGIKRAKGCHACNYTGYRGRVAIHEILLIDKNIREMVSNGARTDKIKQYAIDQQGMKTLREAGIELVEQGVTTMEELIKVAYYA